MAHGDAECGQGDFEGDTATAAWAAGEDGTIVGEHACREPVGRDRRGDGGQDVGGLEDVAGVAGQREAGVVVQQVEDLDLGAVTQGPVGDVSLPAFVGLVGLEALP
jgi:hypothetical protein